MEISLLGLEVWCSETLPDVPSILWNLAGISITELNKCKTLTVTSTDILFIFQARALKLRFNLKHDSSLQHHLSLVWEKAFLKRMETLTVSEQTTLTYATSESLDIELAEHVGLDTKYFALTIVIMVSTMEIS